MNATIRRLGSLVPFLALVVTACSSDESRITNPTAAVESSASVKGGDPAGDAGRTLALLVAPSGARPGVAFSAQPSVAFQSAKGKPLPVGESVSARLVGTDVTLGGTTTVRAVDGVATFSDLSIASAGSYDIEFTAAGANAARASIVVTNPNVCVYEMLLVGGPGITVNGTTATVGPAGGSFTIEVSARPSTCVWSAVSSETWLQVAATLPHGDGGTVVYAVQPLSHSSPARTGIISLAGPPSGSVGTTLVHISQVP